MDFDSFLAAFVGSISGLIEIFISIRRYSSSSKSPSKDRGSLLFIWIVILCSMISTTHYVRLGHGSKIIENSMVKNLFWIPFSLSLWIIGHFIRRQAIEQLGKWFTTAVRTDENQQLIDRGWYARMRHPSYTGALLQFLGVALLLNNRLGLVGIMIPISFVFLYRIHVEEEELERHFGVKYKEYRQRVPRILIPTVF